MDSSLLARLPAELRLKIYDEVLQFAHQIALEVSEDSHSLYQDNTTHVEMAICQRVHELDAQANASRRSRSGFEWHEAQASIDCAIVPIQADITPRRMPEPAPGLLLACKAVYNEALLILTKRKNYTTTLDPRRRMASSHHEPGPDH
jgi:hypothetical protein